MTRIREDLRTDGVPIIRMASDHLRVDVVPEIGGRVVSVYHNRADYEFLWRNANLTLARQPHGSPYDPNFYGGIDECIPSDLPESIDGIASPDHGELWTTPLAHRIEGDTLVMSGRLPACGLGYEKRMRLHAEEPRITFDYRITNPTSQHRAFMWKMHAAVNVEPGDLIECAARKGQVADLAWSRFHSTEPFDWPVIDGQHADRIPPKDGTADFFYLSELAVGEMHWHRPARGLRFRYTFDCRVFPYAILFASYGRLDDHYVAVLEPCSSMPLSVSEASRLGQCSRLRPGESLETSISLYAGPAPRGA